MVSIPGSPNKSEISKMNVIEHHLTAAIQMIAIGCNSYSIHLVVMACEELIATLAGQRNVLLDYDFRIYVKDEYHKQYRDVVRRAYNFCKHADRDPDEKLIEPEEEALKWVNEVQTILNSNGYRRLGGANLQPISDFALLMSIKHPAHFKVQWLDQFPDLKAKYVELCADPSIVSDGLILSLHRKGFLPKIPPF